jgi:hypothetical protein
MRYNGHSREPATEREMAIETSESDENSRLARSQTDPLWLQDHFLGTGHDVTTRNGTASFVSFKGRHFAVTCRHVMESASDPDVVTEFRQQRPRTGNRRGGEAREFRDLDSIGTVGGSRDDLMQENNLAIPVGD